jgi:hypothetical protein
MYTSISLHEYRLMYPHTSTQPTMTENGSLAYLLARIEAKRHSRERRKAAVRAVYKAAGERATAVWNSMRKAFHLPESESQAMHGGRPLAA